MLTRPIPPEAMPVVEEIRSGVPRAGMPNFGGFAFRFGKSKACPMGLHPEAKSICPVDYREFGCLCSTEAVIAFGDWWDEQTDAKAAVDAVWGGRE